jgi:DNA-binding SARP family transcriptional activator
MSATREEVLEALWPDLEPGTALNSLNQTVYFLRRVFEPGFQEETSPAYLGQDGELVWLDGGLVGSQSRNCRALIRSLPRVADPDQALHLAKQYTGRFAIDFMYEDWAADYRDALHTAYLRVIETAIRSDLDTGHYDRGIQIAQLATEVEPEADEIQVSLLRLFRMAGSMAAAAEQYAHYAQAQRELGVEPEPFDQL